MSCRFPEHWTSYLGKGYPYNSEEGWGIDCNGFGEVFHAGQTAAVSNSRTFSRSAVSGNVES